MTTRTALLGMCLTSLFSFVTGLAVSRIRERRRQETVLPVVATVNSEDIRQADLQLALSLYRRRAIEDLVAEKLLLQAAKQKGIEVQPETDPTPEPGIFPDEAVAMARRQRSQKLRRALCLAAFSPAAKRKAFRDLGPELRRYSLWVISLHDQDERAILEREIESGSPLGTIVPKYSVPPGLPKNGHLVDVSRSTVSQLLGPYVGDSLLRMKVGELSPLTPSPFGPVAVKLVQVKQSYEELEPVLDDVLVESEALALDYELGSQAYVTSAYVSDLSRKRKSTGEKPLDPEGLKPIAAQGPSGLPQPKQKPVRKLVGIALPNPPSATPTPAATARRIARPLPLPPLKPLHPTVSATPLGIIKATMERVSHRLLPGSLGQRRVLRLDLNDNHNADPFEPVLVRVTPHGWKPVAGLDHSLSRLVVQNDFGYWKDRAVYAWKGWLWDGQMLLTRPLNGLIEADEVTLHKLQPLDPERHRFEIGAEIQRDEAGRLFHQEQRARYSPNIEVDNQDLRRLKDYLDSDANWAVSQP